jgi:hypothetical protein
MTAPHADDDADLDSALTTRTVQFMAVLAMLAENTARLRAHTAAEKAAREERTVRELRADRLAAHANARALYGPALDRDWVAGADTLDAARVWAASGAWAPVDTEAALAHRRAEERLRQMHPAAMRRYDDLRAAGHDEVEAMRSAAGLFVAADLDTPVLGPSEHHSSTTQGAVAGPVDGADPRTTTRADPRTHRTAPAAPPPPRPSVPAAERWTRSRRGR